jgi:acetylornithine deacetylase/succinyl-diaminopimelate desuccinylase-like protein
MLVNAIALIADGRGKILLEELRAPPMTPSVRAALQKCVFESNPEADARVCEHWAEPGLLPAERVFGSNTFEVLALHAGTPEQPVNAIPPSAIARCQMRFVAGSNWNEFVPEIRKHLVAHGFGAITVEQRETPMPATRLEPDHPVVTWAARSVRETTGKEPTIIPNTGGSLPNDVFADIIGMPTIWVPHGHGGSSQHAPNEHILGSIAREGLEIMTGLFWDLGDEKQRPV